MVELSNITYLRLETTFSNVSDAKGFANSLLKEKLVACAQMVNIRSEYWWKGKIENSDEVLLILKFKRDNLDLVLEKFRYHNYELPEITISEIKVSKEYGEWLENL